MPNPAQMVKPRRNDYNTETTQGKLDYYSAMMEFCIIQAERYRANYTLGKINVEEYAEEQYKTTVVFKRRPNDPIHSVAIDNARRSAKFDYEKSVTGKALIADNQDYQRQADMYSGAISAMWSKVALNRTMVEKA